MDVPDNFRPLAIFATFNDLDIAPQTVTKLMDDQIDVHIIDNWSTDGTFEHFAELKNRRPGLSIERFPQDGPSKYFELIGIVTRKENIAARYPGRWIIHLDSDEVRWSPWSDVSLRHGLFIVERKKFNAVTFTRYDFVPTDDCFVAGADPELHFKYCRISHYYMAQVKTWRQPDTHVDLAATGGHEARFEGRKIYPTPFTLKHYPLRNNEQAKRKVFLERVGRFSPAERAIGWHVQYDNMLSTESFIRDPSEYVEFVGLPTKKQTPMQLIRRVAERARGVADSIAGRPRK